MNTLSKLETYALHAPEVPQWFIDTYTIDRSELPSGPEYTLEQQQVKRYYVESGTLSIRPPFDPENMRRIKTDLKEINHCFDREYAMAVHTQREIAWRRYFANEIMGKL